LVKNPEGYWITTPELDWNTIPARIEGVIEERIGRLDDDLREILTIASVEGEEFTLQVITILKGGNERLLLNSLSQELEKKHRLIKEQSIRHVEDKRLHTFRFRHNLFQQYLYGELGAIEREWLHGEIAVTLEDLYSEEAQQIAPQLAYHFRLAGNSKKAQRYLVEAGRQARDRYANQEAVEYYSQALGLIQKEDVSSHYKILLEREKVHALIGNRQERATDLDSLDLLVADLGDMEKQAEVSLRRAKFAGSTGDYPEAIVAAEQSANFAGVAGFEELVASAQTEWGRALAFTGELDQARAHLMKALKLARDAQATTGAQTSWLKIEAGSLNNLGYIYNIQGDHSSSSAYLEQALAIHRQIGDRRGEGVMLQNLGVVHYDQGDFVNAEIYWEQALRIFQEIGDRQHEAMVMNSLGNISSDLRGDYIEAQLKYGQALTIAQEVGDRLTEGMLLANIGLALSYQHNFDESQGYIHQAMEIYVDIDLKPELGGIYLDSGNTLIGLKQLDEAVNNYTEAIHYAKEFDNRENILEAQAGLARISHLKGEKVKALTLVDAILIQMDKDQAQNPIEPEAAMRVYLICYQILQANLDPRVEEVLQMAYTLLQEQADRITEEGIRQKFLENIPWHREIVENYLKNL
jgi:tetratricopeptide (TPR) repeat protein